MILKLHLCNIWEEEKKKTNLKEVQKRVSWALLRNKKLKINFWWRLTNIELSICEKLIKSGFFGSTLFVVRISVALGKRTYPDP
jgi:hypothetical protein